MIKRRGYLMLGVVLPWLAACAGVPTGPSLPALPGSGQTMTQFRADDGRCRAWAQAYGSGPALPGAAPEAVAGGAAGGAAVGAVAGGVLGGAHAVAPAAVTGGVVGAMVGAGAAQERGRDAQRLYDQAYASCMYERGHKVPLWEGVMPMPPQAPEPPGVPRTPAPRPPAGLPPPPPPSWR